MNRRSIDRSIDSECVEAERDRRRRHRSTTTAPVDGKNVTRFSWRIRALEEGFGGADARRRARDIARLNVYRLCIVSFSPSSRAVPMAVLTTRAIDVNKTTRTIACADARRRGKGNPRLSLIRVVLNRRTDFHQPSDAVLHFWKTHAPKRRRPTTPSKQSMETRARSM